MTKQPNILITGTPGTGKTTIAELAAEKIAFKFLNIGQFVKENECFETFDETYDTYILDEDKLIDLLEPLVGEEGGYIVDFHTPEIFPERWFDLILVLRTETNVLYDRLKDRQYNDIKLNENMECEIMQVVLDSARESYPNEIVNELSSNTLQDLDDNVNRIELWYQQWKQSHT